MRWREGRKSENVEDRRGMPGGAPMMVGGGLGAGAIIIFLIAQFLGVDPAPLLKDLQEQQAQVQVDADQRQPQGEGEDDEMKEFVSYILGSTEDTWEKLFADNNRRYERCTLVLFHNTTDSACGFASAASGPFYCPGDSKVYIDLGFYEELKKRFKAPGDFAQAYVIAHEIGHHIQNQLGISDKVHRMRSQLSEEEYNELSVRLELQADYFAGVWAHHARKFLEPGDIEEALKCAAAIGDDKIQLQSRGYVVPESFTHGSSEQRVRWFKKGFQSGDLAGGDTFSAKHL